MVVPEERPACYYSQTSQAFVSNGAAKSRLYFSDTTADDTTGSDQRSDQVTESEKATKALRTVIAEIKTLVQNGS